MLHPQTWASLQIIFEINANEIWELYAFYAMRNQQVYLLCMHILSAGVQTFIIQMFYWIFHRNVWSLFFCSLYFPSKTSDICLPQLSIKHSFVRPRSYPLINLLILRGPIHPFDSFIHWIWDGMNLRIWYKASIHSTPAWLHKIAHGSSKMPELLKTCITILISSVQ